MIEVSQRKIKCPIFSAREGLIQELNHDIWRENLTSGELMNKTHSLLAELDILADCPKYNQEKSECKTCRSINNLRKERVVYLAGQNYDYNHKTRLTLEQFKNLPGDP